MASNFLKENIIRFLGFFKSEYIPEAGEVVEKKFGDVWVNVGDLRIVKNDLVLTNQKLVVSTITGSGYPGYNFFFSPKEAMGSLDSLIKEVSVKDNTVTITSIGYFRKITLKDKRAQEITLLLEKKLGK